MFETYFNGAPDFNYLVNELDTRSVPAVLGAFGQWRQTRINKQFATNTDAYDVAKAPLSEAYRIWKERKVGDKPILIFDGTMKGTYFQTIRGTRYVEGFTDKKAVWHQRGAGRLPKRQMLPESSLGLPAPDLNKLTTLVTDQIQKDWRRFGKAPTLEELATVSQGDVLGVLGEIAAYANR